MARNRHLRNHSFRQHADVKIQRSVFRRNSQHKTAFNAGRLIPVYVDEVLPGDTFKMRTSFVVRESTLIHPVMDNAYLDLFYFFVPTRLLWEHGKQFNGENTETPWANKTEYSVPQIKAPADGGKVGTLADYFGIPIGVKNIEVSALPFRAYCLIWNEGFRDQNLQQPAFWEPTDATIQGSNDDDLTTAAIEGGFPLKVNKYHDYFTSCLPAPQKGDAVPLPGLTGLSEVHTKHKYYSTAGDAAAAWQTSAIFPGYMHFNHMLQYMPNDQGKAKSKMVRHIGTGPGSMPDDSGYNADTFTGVSGQDSDVLLMPANFYADNSTAAGGTINDLRYAFALQKLYERDARGGTRYTEMIRAHFGVISPDARQQRPEFLGGTKQPINVNQVLQTSSTDATSPQANTAAYSLTSNVRGSFSKSFTEHGYIIGLAVVRTDHTYQQGIERFGKRKTRTDYYLPVFANIGEQPVYNYEIFAKGDANDNNVFGYQEAGADYRYKPSRVSGKFRSTAPGSLDVWHYGDKYADTPVLGAEGITETAVNIDRTLAIRSDKEPQFIADFYFQLTTARPMPLFSVPGFIDRN